VVLDTFRRCFTARLAWSCKGSKKKKRKPEYVQMKNQRAGEKRGLFPLGWMNVGLIADDQDDVIRLKSTSNAGCPLSKTLSRGYRWSLRPLVVFVWLEAALSCLQGVVQTQNMDCIRATIWMRVPPVVISPAWPAEVSRQ
jgi:hypothetical protein